jgi:hypothetical protein
MHTSAVMQDQSCEYEAVCGAKQRCVQVFVNILVPGTSLCSVGFVLCICTKYITSSY